MKCGFTQIKNLEVILYAANEYEVFFSLNIRSGSSSQSIGTFAKFQNGCQKV